MLFLEYLGAPDACISLHICALLCNIEVGGGDVRTSIFHPMYVLIIKSHVIVLLFFLSLLFLHLTCNTYFSSNKYTFLHSCNSKEILLISHYRSETIDPNPQGSKYEYRSFSHVLSLLYPLLNYVRVRSAIPYHRWCYKSAKLPL